MSKNKRRPYWQIEACPPWCGSGHKAGDHPEDRVHYSRWQSEVALSLREEDPQDRKLRRTEHDDFTDEDVPRLEVSLTQHYREVGPRVLVGLSQAPEMFECTPSEARELAKALLKAAELAVTT